MSTNTYLMHTHKPAERRSFLRQLGNGVLGAAAAATGIGVVGQARAGVFDPLYSSGQVFLGSSAEEQEPAPVVTCPLFFATGHFAQASHTLDLSKLFTTGEVLGTMTFHDDTIIPNFSPPSNVAADIVTGTDGINYLLVGGEGTVSGGAPGYFSGVTSAIIRCKYKVDGEPPAAFLRLVACIDCVLILVRR